MLIDTHAHIQFDDDREDLDAILTRAHDAGVDRVICVGTEEVDSAQALAVARAYEHVYAVVGLHPTEADRGYEALEEIQRLVELDPDKVVGIGECGLDFSYPDYDLDAQERALRFQIELALERNLPLNFHVRDAFEAFWTILDDYQGVHGIIHCFTSGVEDMREAVDRGLYVALNGIMTFSKREEQLAAAREVPLENLVLETDSPFLSPSPKRGQRNEPANVAITAAFLAELRGETLEHLSAVTSHNAKQLFAIE